MLGQHGQGEAAVMRLVRRLSWAFLFVVWIGFACGCDHKSRRLKQGMQDVDAHAREIERQAEPSNAEMQNPAKSK